MWKQYKIIWIRPSQLAARESLVARQCWEKQQQQQQQRQQQQQENDKKLFPIWHIVTLWVI